MLSTAFWKAAAERAVKTAAQTGLVAFGATVFTDIGEVVPSLQAIGLAALSGAILSLLTSIGSDAVSAQAGPSLTDAEVLPDEAGA